MKRFTTSGQLMTAVNFINMAKTRKGEISVNVSFVFLVPFF